MHSPASSVASLAAVHVEPYFTPGLGDASYVVASGGDALVVDPQRDVGRFLDDALAEGLHVRYVVETHVHNDYVSGSAEVRARTGATIVGPAEAGFGFEHRAIDEGDDLRLGDLRLVALRTPGHTPEHLSYALHEGDRNEPTAVFTGGSLIVGNAGRTDLLGEERANELTRAQFRSLRRLSALPDATLVLPTHGAGSFCTAGEGVDERTSTIGRERDRNPALAAPDEDSFVRQQLSGLQAFPRYYSRMAPINRSGPPVVGNVPQPPPLTVEDVETEMTRGAALVDGRSGAAFAARHVPGSVNVPLDDLFASYVGWVLPFDAAIALLLPEPVGERLAEAAAQLFRIGRERVLGYLRGGVSAWIDAGRETRRYPTVSADDLASELRAGADAGGILDVRQLPEWEAGHVEGSLHLFIGDLPPRIGELPRDRDLTVACATGHRSSIGASLLQREGFAVRLVTPGGIPRALRRMGRG
jgi:glyoxylase-like metal-dependent hydrolase (beta-lactamase superfamily II)/rhodanese-related sulfurtransferase